MVRRARPIVKAAMGISLSKRFILNRLTIPDVTAADFDNPLEVDLLECVETMDEEVESDGTNIADCPLYSRITSIRGKLIVEGNTSTSIMFRWLLYKMPDGEDLTADLQAATFHSSNDTPTLRELRKFTLAKGMFVANPSSAVSNVPLFIRKQALARVSPLRENDKIRLVIAKATEGTTGTLSGFGTITVRANA